MKQLSALSAFLQLPKLSHDVPLVGVKTDTRDLHPGELFVALKGPCHDGHDFVSKAKELGAVAAVVSRSVPVDLPQWVVEDTLATFGQIGHFYRQQVHCPVIAITGTCGKTSVRTMLTHVLSDFGEVLTNTANHNNQIGVPQTLVRLQDHHAYAVVECGTNYMGEIAKLSAMVAPDIAIITNVDAGHLEGIGSVDQVLQEKSSMLGFIKPNGIAILNADQPYLAAMQGHLVASQQLMPFGNSPKAMVKAEHVIFDAQGCARFQVTFKGGSPQQFRLPLPGEHQVMNALAVIAACIRLDLTLEDVAKSLEKAPGVPRRLVRRNGLRGSVLLDDSYNANPRSFAAALQVLAAQASKKLLVMGEMRELGSDARLYHQQVGEKAAELGIDAIVAYGELCKHTVDAFGSCALYFESRSAMIEYLLREIDKDWTLLIKGSLSTKMIEVVEAMSAQEVVC